MPELTHAEISRRGGHRTQELHGKRLVAEMQAKARKALDAKADLTGVDLNNPVAVELALEEHRRRHYAEMSRKGVAARLAKRMAARFAARSR